MKCDIVRDLLPSYIDGLCSNESKSIIEKHLKQCEECKMYYNNMVSDLSQLSEVDEAFFQENLKEKSLLVKSEKHIKAMQANKIMKYINVICIIINVLFLLVGIGFVYYNGIPKYPHITLGAQYLPIMLFSILPSILAIIQLCLLKRMKHYIFRMVSNIFLQGLFLVLGFVSVICLFVLVPPLESMTDAAENYLIVDKEIEKFNPVFTAFFPDAIPEQANNIEYYYRQKKGLFSEEITITATWVLPVKEYEETKNTIRNEHYVEEIEKNKWSVIVKGIHYPEKATLHFIYDDNSRTVSYAFKVDKSF